MPTVARTHPHEMEVDHDLVAVDEFDALCIEVVKRSRPPPLPSTAPKKYPAKLHAQRVAKELGVSHGLLYLPGEPGNIVFEDSDIGPAFRQRRYFYYLAGTDFGDCTVTYDVSADSLVLWIPYSDPRQLLWYGKYPSREDCAQATDVDDIRYVDDLEHFLKLALTDGKPLFVIHEDQVPANWAAHHGSTVIDTDRLGPAMDSARVIKDDYEIEIIRRANAVSSEAHRRVLLGIRHMTNEREIEARFRGYSLSVGAKRQAYPVIAASGANAAVLHYMANNEPLADRQLVTLDAGAEWQCYASDVTRTFPVSGRFTAEAAAVYGLVERMQSECTARVAPGVIFYSLHLHAMTVAVEGLLSLGILRGGTVKDILAAGTGAAFFPHGLGHHVGLEVHDVLSGALLGHYAVSGEALQGKRKAISAHMNACLAHDAHALSPSFRAGPKLEAGMIVTVEPGIYFCREYIEAFFLAEPAQAKYIDAERLEKYYPVGGVRIEDCILVTEDGHENLTTAPKGEEMLRVINSGEDRSTAC